MSKKSGVQKSPDEREKARKLTEAEKKRLEGFEKISERMKSEGYRRVDLTVSIVWANVFAIILLAPVLAIGLWAFIARNGASALMTRPETAFISIAALIVMVVVHELIHGLSWAPFTGSGFKDIEFGFMKQYLTPYCTCRIPLKKGQYIFGTLTPLVILGIVPMVWGVLAGSFTLLFLGIIMTTSAAGDILVVWNLLRYKSGAKTVVYMDHPTQAGGVIFER